MINRALGLQSFRFQALRDWGANRLQGLAKGLAVAVNETLTNSLAVSETLTCHSVLDSVGKWLPRVQFECEKYC